MISSINTQWTRGIMQSILVGVPDSEVHGVNMGPTWVQSAPDGPHIGPRNLAIRGSLKMNLIK